MAEAETAVRGIDYPVIALLAGCDADTFDRIAGALAGRPEVELIHAGAEEGANPQKIAAHRGVTVVVQWIEAVPEEGRGLQPIRDFRESEVCRDLPVVALLPQGGEMEFGAPLRAGADAVLPDSVAPETLLLQMRALARVCFERIELDSLRQALRKTRKQLHEARARADRLTEQDPLTGMFTAQRFALLYEMEWQRAMRETNPIALLAIGIDDFDGYAARFGRQVADDCLRQVARAILSCLNRTTDIAARDEGGGFMVLLPNTPASGGIKVGSAILQTVRELRLLRDGTEEGGCVTVSLGLVTTSPMIRHTAQMFRLAAAKALADARARGGDQLASEAI